MEILNLQVEAKKIFPRFVIPNSFFKYFVVFVRSLRVPKRFKSSTYTTIIVNPISDLLIKMHGHIRLFAYPSFNKYSLRKIYHMRPDYFNPYRDCCNLIEHILRDFIFFALGNLNPSRILI